MVGVGVKYLSEDLLGSLPMAVRLKIVSLLTNPLNDFLANDRFRPSFSLLKVDHCREGR